MKRLLLNAFFFGLFSTTSYGQSSAFEIIKVGNQYSQSILNETMSKVDFCGMINPSESYLIVFDDGSEVKVKSAIELQTEVVPTCIREINIVEEGINWSIKGNSILMKSTTTKNIKKS